MIEINSVAIVCANSKAKRFCFYTISVQLSTADVRPPSRQNDLSARLPYKKKDYNATPLRIIVKSSKLLNFITR